MATAAPPESALLPITEAAQALGVSVSAVRRGLKSGRYRGRRQETPQGFVWLVEVGSERVSGHRIGDDRVGEHRVPDLRVVGDRVGGDRGPEAPQAGPQGALLSDRAAEMARYSRELLAPVLARLEAQATEIGVLTERTATLQATVEAQARRIAELEAPPAPAPQTESAPAPEWEARRWWQRLLWG